MSANSFTTQGKKISPYLSWKTLFFYHWNNKLLKLVYQSQFTLYILPKLFRKKIKSSNFLPKFSNSVVPWIFVSPRIIFLSSDLQASAKPILRRSQLGPQAASAVLAGPHARAPVTSSAVAEGTRSSGSRASSLATAPSTGAVEWTARGVETTNGWLFVSESKLVRARSLIVEQA